MTATALAATVIDAKVFHSDHTKPNGRRYERSVSDCCRKLNKEHKNFTNAVFQSNLQCAKIELRYGEANEIRYR
ncbi:hypothetical protein [Mesorhizobium vachelliae]|uniref:hypothetical protein n=1 Tax=Mesorhizobium vachelliae TaxID=3072309 RepID=UPI003D31D37F